MKFAFYYRDSNTVSNQWLFNILQCDDTQHMLNHVAQHSSCVPGFRYNLIKTVADNPGGTELCWYQVWVNGELTFDWHGALSRGDYANTLISELQNTVPDYQVYCSNLPNSPLICYCHEEQLCLCAHGIFYSGTIIRNMNGWMNHFILP